MVRRGIFNTSISSVIVKGTDKVFFRK